VSAQHRSNGLCRPRNGHLSRSANKHIALDGRAQDKYFARAQIFADETENILERKGVKSLKGKKAHILVVGATAGTIRALLKRGFEVSATDPSPAIVGMELGRVKICNAKTANARLMKKADLAIMTGMTLPNRTLPGLLKLARQYNTSTMIWAITGKNFGSYFTEVGVDCVISDPTPFLQLPGPTWIGIWRRER
jgi:hypothetical protein